MLADAVASKQRRHGEATSGTASGIGSRIISVVTVDSFVGRYLVGSVRGLGWLAKCNVMGKTVIGKLKEKLIIETDESIIGYPAGTIVEVSSEEEYPHDVSDVAVEEIAKYLEKNANNVVWKIPEGQEVTSISAAIMRCCDDQQKKEIFDKLSRRIDQ